MDVCKILASAKTQDISIYQSDQSIQVKDALQAGGRRFESVYLHPMAVTQCDCLFCYYPLFNIFERQKNHIVPNK